MKYLGIDFGGTWIKGAAVNEDFFVKNNASKFQIEKIKSPLHTNAEPAELVKSLSELMKSMQLKSEEVGGIGISTAGIVDYHGTKVIKSAPHLNVLRNDRWKIELEKQFGFNVNLINDADAATIGLAELGYLKGDKAIGVMPIGTGLGFSVWRNGRRWRPGKSLTLLGSITFSESDFDALVSASRLAALDKNHDLLNVLLSVEFKDQRESYLQNLVKVINSAAILYNLDEVVICGGLADAAKSCNYPLEQLLNAALEDTPVELMKIVKVRVAGEGNRLQLMGAMALAKGESIALKNKVVSPYKKIATEMPYKKELQLQNMQTEVVVETLWLAEQEAGILLKNSLSVISNIADKAVEKIKKGGRIIYVGCGTSGRIAAMDAVEIPCTYGFPQDKVLAIISGGISDAVIEIESDFEEDASAVPEMLLMNIQPEDIVIGISASGTAYFVQSALAFSKSRNALSVMIQSELPENKLPFCNEVIALQSGYEVVAGSTRMKAGTATKKILNFLSSTIMIKIGKVIGSYMVDVACINKKLVERAQAILGILYQIDKDKAYKLLQASEMDLGETIRKINNK